MVDVAARGFRQSAAARDAVLALRENGGKSILEFAVGCIVARDAAPPNNPVEIVGLIRFNRFPAESSCAVAVSFRRAVCA